MKRKEESIYKEIEFVVLKRKENVIELKGEIKIFKKIKSFLVKKEFISFEDFEKKCINY